MIFSHGPRNIRWDINVPSALVFTFIYLHTVQRCLNFTHCVSAFDTAHRCLKSEHWGLIPVLDHPNSNHPLLQVCPCQNWALVMFNLESSHKDSLSKLPTSFSTFRGMTDMELQHLCIINYTTLINWGSSSILHRVLHSIQVKTLSNLQPPALNLVVINGSV